MTAVELLITTGCGIAFYLVLANRLFRWTQAARLDMARVGQKLLDDDRISDERKRSVESRLNKAFSPGSAWMYALLATPAAIATLIDYCKDRPEVLSQMPSDLREDWLRFAFVTLVSVLGNSPLATVLFVIQTTTFALLFIPLGRFVRELLSVNDAVSRVTDQDDRHHNHA